MSELAAPAIAERRSYDPVTISFHWLTALIVLVQFVTPLLWEHREWRRQLETLHVSLGIALAAVLIGRLVWRLTAGRRLPAADEGPLHWLALIVHAGLYLLLAAQVVLGFVLRWAQGEGLSFFGLFAVPSPIASSRPFAHQIEEIHNIVGWAIVYIAAFHAIGALAHHYYFKDHVLRRMIPSAAVRS